MGKRRLGRTGIEVSVLGFGGSEIGERGAPLKAVEALLGSALDSGLNVIDTAACYGASEELIGRAVGHRRKDFFVFTKCGHASGLRYRDWSAELVEKSIERSVERLRTDYVDLVQLHSCGIDLLRDGRLLEALKRARSRGMVRWIGYSGDGEAALYAVRSGEFDVLQTSVSIADQEAIDLTLPTAVHNDVGVIAKRPIANAAWLGRKSLLDLYSRPYRQRLRKLQYDFLKRPAHEAIQIALLFTLSVPGVHTAIVGTSKPSRWEENAALCSAGPLAPAQYEAIRRRWRDVAQRDWVGQQ
jgi:aryl-alcohol dehydrogenase-like predicted oxidoreductase